MKTSGASYLGNNYCSFSVWAPEKKSMTLHIMHPIEQKIDMAQDEWGYYHVRIKVQPGTRYWFMPEGEKDLPDPASHYQPEGVHGPSEVVDHKAFDWTDIGWQGLPFRDLILYEIHVGTFTQEGTFEAIIPVLDDLISTGINAIELMPVNQFPGKRNWGYDGVYPYAVQNSYGGPEGLKKLVNACHQKGIAVFLDVVYNHVGPEGNYFTSYGPYFTKKYSMPWGDAINFDGEWSDGVRDYFSDNALFWFQHYHVDGLRVDAIHTVFDTSAIHFWELTTNKVKQLSQALGRSLYLIAESDLNSTRVIKNPENGGYGFHAQWLDDFHHALYVLLDKKGQERYVDFGSLEQLAKAYTDGFVLSGEFVKFRKRKYGASSAGTPGDKFVVFNLNHDQVGNRAAGERLCMLIDFERLKIAAAALFLSPYVPMLFMGEEYADDSPFLYFTDHSDEALIRAVQKGRREEFARFKSTEEPADPQSENTFFSSKLHWHKRKRGRHLVMLAWHKALIAMRKTNSVFQNFNKDNIHVNVIEQRALVLLRGSESGQNYILGLLNFSEDEVAYTLPTTLGMWKKLLDSTDEQWLESQGSSKIDNSINHSAIKIPPLSVLIFKNE